MIVEQYGIKLKRLNYADIEMVRHWRNSPDIRDKMAFKKYITKRKQQEWFNSIDNKWNYYFLIEYKGKDIGLINSKNVNLSEMYGEGGIFIWEENIDNEYAPVLVSLCFLNTVFFLLKLFNKSFIQILKDNKRAINFNRSLGYVLIPRQEKIENQYYVLTKEDYIQKTEKLRKVAEKLTNDYSLPRISGEVSDRNLNEINNLLKMKNG